MNQNDNTIDIEKGKLIIYNLEKDSEVHKIDIKQLEGIYIYRSNTRDTKKSENDKLKDELNFSSGPFNIEYIFECSINQLPLYLLSNKRYKLIIDPQCTDTFEWFSEKFCIQETLTKTENCILVKFTSEKSNILSPQPPMIMVIQGVLCNEEKEKENNVLNIMSNDVIDIDEWDLLTKRKKYKVKSKKEIRLEMIPLFSCMELENIIDIIHEYRDNISKLKIISSLKKEQIRDFSNQAYSLISHLNIIPNHIFIEFFTKYMMNYNLYNNNRQENTEIPIELDLKNNGNNYKDLYIDKELILQDTYRTPKPKKLKSEEEQINIFDGNSEKYEIRYLILKKLLETSSKEIMEQRKKERISIEKSSTFNFEAGVVNKIKRNIKRSSSPAPSDSSTLSTLSVLSLQRKINDKSSNILYGKKKPLMEKKKSKSNSIADKNKMKLWHLTKKAVASTLHIDPNDEKFNTTRTKVYRSCIYALKEKMNKKEISNEKLKQIVDYQVNIFNII
ncbi:hypothetical protein BCR36DRAFT_415164 [Piromyces finnis]|uniref:Sld7 C-terminal domain-containing protein n=1 Tax=Piromyces finnis TaxID=1754191 RepID=A0A1Y1UZT6_9FUNG|nr:hypothetical protein BCR36DRAFT_415164 [Piromyces finnis]|eukprot:ORX44125.1 hypothetical protein BCR36DRAFT_415164 [Piromyces finnis]